MESHSVNGLNGLNGLNAPNALVTSAMDTTTLLEKRKKSAIATRKCCRECAVCIGAVLGVLALAFWLTGCNPDLHYACPLMQSHTPAYISEQDWQSTACHSHCGYYVKDMEEYECSIEEYDEQNGATYGMRFSVENTKCYEKAPMAIDCNDYQTWFTKLQSGSDDGLFVDWNWKRGLCHFQRKTTRYTWTAIALAIVVGGIVVFAVLCWLAGCLVRQCRDETSTCFSLYLLCLLRDTEEESDS
jgi:hypothetical protein